MKFRARPTVSKQRVTQLEMEEDKRLCVGQAEECQAMEEGAQGKERDT